MIMHGELGVGLGSFRILPEAFHKASGSRADEEGGLGVRRVFFLSCSPGSQSGTGQF